METVNIAGLDKAEVLAALYNASKPQGMGFMNPLCRSDLTTEQAVYILQTQGDYFDYLQGRVMKVDLSQDKVNTWGYDRDNGEGAFATVINRLRSVSS